MDILKQHLNTSARKLKLRCKLLFQVDNDPNHASKVVEKWLQDKKVKWPSQSLGLNLIENVWAEVTKHVRTRMPTNLIQFHHFCQEEWPKMSATYCEMLVEGYLKRLTQMKQRNATKH